MLNRSARRTLAVLTLLAFGVLPVAAEPARSRPAGPVAIFSELMTSLTAKLLGLWEKTDGTTTSQPPKDPDQNQTLDCRSTIDPWGCPKP